MDFTSTWDYKIRGFASHNRGGGLLLETVHKGEASRNVEIEAWRSRARREGGISHVEVVDMRRHTTETIYLY